MMLKTLEKSGKTEEAAIAAALEELGLDRDDVSVEIVERAKSGFLGIGPRPYLPPPQRMSRRAMRASARSSAACSSTWASRRRSRSPHAITAV